MDKCIEHKTHVFIQDKNHMTKVYVMSFNYLGFPCKGKGPFFNEQQKKF